MSWDATLIATDLDNHTYEVYDVNYTHNCNGMAAKVLTAVGHEVEADWWDGDRPGTSWWRILDGQTSKESLDFLDLLIGGLNEAPDLFREMNPDNGWGDYDSFIAILVAMRAKAAEYPSARWQVSG